MHRLTLLALALVVGLSQGAAAHLNPGPNEVSKHWRAIGKQQKEYELLKRKAVEASRKGDLRGASDLYLRVSELSIWSYQSAYALNSAGYVFIKGMTRKQLSNDRVLLRRIKGLLEQSLIECSEAVVVGLGKIEANKCRVVAERNLKFINGLLRN